MASAVRNVWLAIVIAAMAGVPATGRAEDCGSTCGAARTVCVTQARTTLRSCMASCAPGSSARQCRRSCVQTRAQARVACTQAQGDCRTTCPIPPAESCASCGTEARACFAAVLNTVRGCAQNCGSAADRATCLRDCVTGLRSGGAVCFAGLGSCVSACRGETSGMCFDTATFRCTAQACSPTAPCDGAGAFCSARCPTTPPPPPPPPPSLPPGKCFDLTTKACTDQACSRTEPCGAHQVCSFLCPPPTGRCFDLVHRACTADTCTLLQRCPTPKTICVPFCFGSPGGAFLDEVAG